METSFPVGRALVLGVAGLVGIAGPSCGGDAKPSGAAPSSGETADAPRAGRTEGEILVVDPATAGTIRGLVRFEGEPPPARIVEMRADPVCHALQGQRRVREEQVVVNEDGTLRNVFVQVVKGLEGKRFEPPAETTLLDQTGCVYVPHVLALRTGQTLVVRNSDRTNHNINGAGAKKNRGFNFGQTTAGIEDRLTFENPETFPVRCDRHGWMQAWIHVVAHPYFAVTADGGAFEIANLPPGAYTIEAWHEKYEDRPRREVTLAPSATETVEFVFRADEARK